VIPAQNPFYRTALAGPHDGYGRVEVWRGGVPVEELTLYDPTLAYKWADSPVFLSGSVRATLTSRVARTLSLTVSDKFYPYEATDLLNPYTTQLRAFRGVRYGAGDVDEFPVFVGAVETLTLPANGTTTITAVDRSGDVVLAGFPNPQQAQVGDLVTDEFKRVILDALPDAQFGPFSEIMVRVPELSYDYDRGSALDSLARTASAVWYALADGRFVLRFVPWTVPVTTQLLDLHDGPGGVLLAAAPTRSRTGVYSRVTVSSERPDGSTPVSATVDDLDPTSPTYALGPFGIRALQVRVTGAGNQGQVLATAKTLLNRAKALTESWQFSIVPDGSIELGDPVELSWKGRLKTQIIAGFQIPLDATTVMSCDGRDLSSGELPS